MPECPELLKRLGYQKVRKLFGTVGAELCVVLDNASRAPAAFAFGPVYTSEKALLAKVADCFHEGQLVLLDAGYHGFANLKLLRARGAHFLLPIKSTARPRMVKRLRGGDYIAEIVCAETKEKMLVRVVYTQQPGFKRRRLTTSLLDPKLHPHAELEAIYHERWHIETFYRDFKVAMEGNKWHCLSLDAFEKELLCKLALVCLTRLAAGEAAARRRLAPGMISFARGLAGGALLLAAVVGKGGAELLAAEWRKLVGFLAKHVIRIKPGRSFPRDKNQYRKKNRTRGSGKVGRPRKPRPEAENNRLRPETLTDSKGMTWLLS